MKALSRLAIILCVLVSSLSLQVANIAPAIFTANQSGSGVPAAEALRVAAGGQQSVVPILLCTGGAASCTALPIPRWPADEELFLVLYATGLRHRTPEETVSVRIGGQEADVTYAGLQPQFSGLDQVNVRVPRDLQGRGLVDLVMRVGAAESNTVQVLFQ